MTATTAVPSFRRLARLTPYLLAAGLAIAAWLLLGTHIAFAEERTGSGSPRHHVAEATEQAPQHAHPIAPKETGAATAAPAAHVGQSPGSFAPAGHSHTSGNAIGRPAEAQGPTPVQAVAPPPAAVRQAYTAPQQTVPIVTAHSRHVERTWTSQQPVPPAVPETAPSPPAHRPAEAEGAPPVQGPPPPAAVRPVYTEPQQTAPIPAAHSRHVEQRAWTGQPAVPAAVPETA
jgi:hypothetical protein